MDSKRSLEDTQPTRELNRKIDVYFEDEGGESKKITFTRNDLYCLNNTGYKLFLRLCSILTLTDFDSYNHLYAKFLEMVREVTEHTNNGDYITAHQTVEDITYPLFEAAIYRLPIKSCKSATRNLLAKQAES